MVGAKESTLVPMGEELLRATFIPASTRFLIPLNWLASLERWLLALLQSSRSGTHHSTRASLWGVCTLDWKVEPTTFRIRAPFTGLRRSSGLKCGSIQITIQIGLVGWGGGGRDTCILTVHTSKCRCKHVIG